MTVIGCIGHKDHGKSTIMAAIIQECLRQDRFVDLHKCDIGMTEEGRALQDLEMKYKQKHKQT